jgi:putative addiction module killer protein
MTAPAPKKTLKTPEYRKWEDTLNDVAAAAVDARIKNLQYGKKGDCAPVGEGVCELRFKQTGPGWRVYFHETNAGALVLLLLGGDKSRQKADIKEAKKILKDLKAKQAAIKKAKKGAGGKARQRKNSPDRKESQK